MKLEPDYFEYLIPYFDQPDTFGVMGRIENWDDDTIQDGAKFPVIRGVKIKTFVNYLPVQNQLSRRYGRCTCLARRHWCVLKSLFYWGL